MAVSFPGVVGRDEELGAVVGLLDGEFPGALLIQGEPGIGKTTVWRAGVEQARDRGLRTLLCRPAESEARLSFAGLTDLLEPVLSDVLTVLPTVQRRALEAALLLSEHEGPPPDQRAISSACLTVLRRLAEEGPVLVAVDDVQWLDPPTELVLEFVARRLGAEPVALLVAERVEADSQAPLGLGRAELGLRRIRMGPLSMGALHRLLRDRVDVTLSRPALRRVHEASGGNPLYALELVRVLQASGGRIRPGQPLPVPQTLEAILRVRIEALPAGAREVLPVAAALAHPTEAVLGDRLAVDQAVEAGVVELIDGEVRFTHPLLSSAAYASIAAEERRRLHRRLAAAVDDPEERARHLALGAEEPSAEIARTLDEAARRAAARGAPAVAAELAQLAGRLTPAEERARFLERRSDAAAYHYRAGDLAEAAAILERVIDELPPGELRADALRQLADAQQGSFERSLELANEALVEAQGDDTRVAQIEERLSAYAQNATYYDQALAHARLGLEAAERAGDEAALALALATVAILETGSAVEATPGLLERAVALEDAGLVLDPYVSPSKRFGVRLMCEGRLDEARERLFRAFDNALGVGDERAQIGLFILLAELECRAGNWELADGHAADAYEHAEQIGHEHDMSAGLYARALVDAHRGLADQAREEAERGIALSESCGDEIFLCQSQAVLGFLELSVGAPAAADRILRPLAAHLASARWREPSFSGELPNAIEALIELGELEEARRLLADLQDRVGRIVSPWGEASAGRCQGLILASEGELPAALAACEGAVAVHARLPQPFDLGRTLLAQGVIQRRARRRRAARETLERALGIFDQLGAALWAEKARAELARLGGRRGHAADELTPSERRIAELVAEGRTNKEVAAILVIADRTVESALTQVYRKLDVRSRTELARKLPEVN